MTNSTTNRGVQHALTDEHKSTFLRVLADTGSTSAAAEAATASANGSRGGIQTFYDERKRDPAFAYRVYREDDQVEIEVQEDGATVTTIPVDANITGSCEVYEDLIKMQLVGG